MCIITRTAQQASFIPHQREQRQHRTSSGAFHDWYQPEHTNKHFEPDDISDPFKLIQLHCSPLPNITDSADNFDLVWHSSQAKQPQALWKIGFWQRSPWITLCHKVHVADRSICQDPKQRHLFTNTSIWPKQEQHIESKDNIEAQRTPLDAKKQKLFQIR